MPIVTLHERLYGDVTLKSLESEIQSLFEGLEVTAKVETTNRRWINATIAGNDQIVAMNLLEEKLGFAPVDMKNVMEGSLQQGKIVSDAKDEVGIHVDIGIFHPSPTDAVLPLWHLQAQLVDGKKLPLKRIIRLFCLQNNFPLRILIKRFDQKQRFFRAELSEKQIQLFTQWTDSNLERLVVLGTFRESVEKAVKAAGHIRDVADIESLGLLEHAVVCKLGTNAAGLIPKIGRLLPNVVFGAFLPMEIQRLFRA